MITKAIPFEGQIRDFVGRKHGILYEQAWLSMFTEHQTLSLERQSVRATSLSLAHLLKSRLKRNLQRAKADEQA